MTTTQATWEAVGVEAGKTYPVVRRQQSAGFTGWHTTGWESLGAGVIVCGLYHSDQSGGGSLYCVRLADGTLIAAHPSRDEQGNKELHAEAENEYRKVRPAALEALAGGRRTWAAGHGSTLTAERLADGDVVEPVLSARS